MSPSKATIRSLLVATAFTFSSNAFIVSPEATRVSIAGSKTDRDIGSSSRLCARGVSSGENVAGRTEIEKTTHTAEGDIHRIVNHCCNTKSLTRNGGDRTSSKRQKDRKRKKKVPSIEPIYWRNLSDALCMIVPNATATNNTENLTLPCTSVRLTVRGKPIPLRRHRTSKGFMYNPSAQAQQSFRRVVKDMLFPVESDEQEISPLFGDDKYIAISILFRLRRPKRHFIANRPGEGRLRPTAPQMLHPSRTDVDNLAKFVLDSMNLVLYSDDRQIVSLHAAKVFDNEGTCEGATEICARILEEKDVADFLETSFPR